MNAQVSTWIYFSFLLFWEANPSVKWLLNIVFYLHNVHIHYCWLHWIRIFSDKWHYKSCFVTVLFFFQMVILLNFCVLLLDFFFSWPLHGIHLLTECSDNFGCRHPYDLTFSHIIFYFRVQLSRKLCHYAHLYAGFSTLRADILYEMIFFLKSTIASILLPV